MLVYDFYVGIIFIGVKGNLISKGPFNNYVDKKGWVGGQLNVYVCPHGVGGWSVQCLCT